MAASLSWLGPLYSLRSLPVFIMKSVIYGSLNVLISSDASQLYMSNSSSSLNRAPCKRIHRYS